MYPFLKHSWSQKITEGDSKTNFQLQLYLNNSWQYRTKRTGPQIAFANLGGTVTLEDNNENKYTKFTKDFHDYL